MMGDPDGTDDRARVHWSVPPPPSNGESEPHAAALGEEFLFHLYRGSELLKDDQFYEAKSELERALSLQPRDVEGQSLLGVVYFRLGHYPRAIQIYEELIRVRPAEVSPRVNLALCYLKTGQLASARGLLEELVQHKPEHTRAWGYLGLAYQRLGDFDKASVAFERAGRPQLAQRIRASHVPEPPSLPDPPEPESSAVQEIPQHHVRAAVTLPPPPPNPEAPPVGGSIPPRSVSVRAAPGTRVSVPVSLARAAREATFVFPETPRVVLHDDGVVLTRIERAFHARADCIRAVLPDRGATIARRLVRRRHRGLLTEEPLGGLTSPFVTLEGEGRLVLGVPHLLSAFITSMDEDPLYAREERLLGFDASVEYECGRLELPDGDHAGLVQLSGLGTVVLSIRGPVHGIEVFPDRPAEVRAARLIGWIGRILARPADAGAEVSPLRGLMALSGNGVALFDGG
jgi:hypothetical protein